MICNNGIIENQNNITMRNTSFREYVNYTIQVNCGITKIKIDEKKIDEYYQKYIKEVSDINNIDIGLINLIASKISVYNKLNNKIYISENKKVQINFENTEIKMNRLREMFNYLDNLKNLDNKINQTINFCNSFDNKFTENQLIKKKNNKFGKKAEKIIYESYDELKNIKISEDDIKNFGLNIYDINHYIINKINKKVLHYYNFLQCIYILTIDEYNKIKENVEDRQRIEDEIFKKKMEPILQSKINEVSLKYDKLIKGLIENNEKKGNELRQTIKELKDNSEKASLELLEIIECKDKIERNNIELEENIIELLEKTTKLEKNNKTLLQENKKLENNIYELEQNKLEEVLFIEDIIKRSSICEMEASS